MTRPRALPLRRPWIAAAAILTGCVVGDVELAGKGCPCVAGWQCVNGMCVTGSANGDGGVASGPVALQLAPTVTLAQGKSAPLAVTWTAPDDGELQVTVTGVPAGVSVNPGVLALSKSAPSATFTLSAASDAPTLSSTLVVKALAPNGDARGTANVALTVVGRSGALDGSFGVAGVAALPSHPPWFAELRGRADGRYVIAASDSSPGTSTGKCIWLQLEPDGKPDDTFAQGVTFGDGCHMNGMALTADGSARALVQVSMDAQPPVFQLRGLTPSGAPDTSFGASGQAVFTADLIQPHTDFWMQSDGKIVVGGRSGSAGVVARYGATGALDATFGSGGTVTGSFGTWAFGVVEQPDGKILVASAVSSGSTITRVDATGAVDATYGTGGAITVNAPVLPLFAVQPDGKLLFETEPQGGSGVRLVRYDVTGQPDALPDGGAPIAPLQTNNALYVSPTGQIYLVGTTHGLLAIARLRPTMELDTDFGDAGLVTGPPATGAYGFVIDPEGKMVVLGATDTTWFVARMWP